MSDQQKRSIISIICTSLVYIVYCIYLYQKYQAGELDPINDFRFWGSVILILIAVQIVFNIVITIIFSIVYAIITNDQDCSSFTDERDKLIELKSIRISYIVVGIGFLISMVTLVIGMPPFVMFNIVFFSFNLAEIIGSVSQLYFYKRGF